MLIGYGRASTTGQSLTSQRAQLLKAGCQKIFEEKLTGAERKRPQLARLLREIDGGDTLIITGLDRLARSTHDLLDITQTLDHRGIGIRSLGEPWADTTSATGEFLVTVFAGLSELERCLIRDRSEEGRIAAKERGVKFGRKHKLTDYQRGEVMRMLDEGVSIRGIARHFNVGVATIDRVKNSHMAN
ncbi:MAG: recombinase family protein [Pseudomonadota bacterium]|nr:recombinase family protein [Pseudomonadota bacterium]